MRLVATREVRYANHTYLPGDTFEATESHAKVLKAIKKAADAPAEPPAPTQVRALVAEEPAPTAPSRRGRYARRDMRAADGNIRMDMPSKVKAAADGVADGVFSPNEARRRFNLPALTGGDTIYMQQQDGNVEVGQTEAATAAIETAAVETAAPAVPDPDPPE